METVWQRWHLVWAENTSPPTAGASFFFLLCKISEKHEQDNYTNSFSWSDLRHLWSLTLTASTQAEHPGYKFKSHLDLNTMGYSHPPMAFFFGNERANWKQVCAFDWCQAVTSNRTGGRRRTAMTGVARSSWVLDILENEFFKRQSKKLISCELGFLLLLNKMFLFCWANTSELPRAGKKWDVQICVHTFVASTVSEGSRARSRNPVSA